MFTRITALLIITAVTNACAIKPNSTLNERLAYEIPEHFKPYHSSKKLNESTVKFALTKKGQTQWEQLLTVHTMFGTDTPNPKSYLIERMKKMAKNCVGSDIAPLFTASPKSVNETFEGNLFCYRNMKSKRGEVFIMKSIEGENGLYTITRAFRAEPFTKEQVGNLVPWLNKFEPTVHNANLLTQ